MRDTFPKCTLKNYAGYYRDSSPEDMQYKTVINRNFAAKVNCMFARRSFDCSKLGSCIKETTMYGREYSIARSLVNSASRRALSPKYINSKIPQTFIETD